MQLWELWRYKTFHYGLHLVQGHLLLELQCSNVEGDWASAQCPDYHWRRPNSQNYYDALLLTRYDTCALHHVATSLCRGHVDELATEPFLLLHREHGTGYLRSWNCCDRRTRFVVIWKHFVSFCLRAPGYRLTLWCALGLVRGAIHAHGIRYKINHARTVYVKSIKFQIKYVLTFCKFEGIARTQSPTNRNYALDLPTFGVIAWVNPTEVQWKGLALGDRPCWSPTPPCQVSMIFCFG